MDNTQNPGHELCRVGIMSKWFRIVILLAYWDLVCICLERDLPKWGHLCTHSVRCTDYLFIALQSAVQSSWNILWKRDRLLSKSGRFGYKVVQFWEICKQRREWHRTIFKENWYAGLQGENSIPDKSMKPWPRVEQNQELRNLICLLHLNLDEDFNV